MIIFSIKKCVAQKIARDRFFRRFAFNRNMLVAMRGLDQVAAGREGEVIAGHQHAVRGGAIEQLLASGDGRLAVKKISHANRDGARTRPGAARCRQGPGRLIAGMDRKDRVAGV